MRNLRLAVRTLFKTPVVTVVAVLSLALGIGANAAIFSLFDEMLLRPLPVPHPEQLVNVTAPGPTPGSHSNNESGNNESIFSYPMLRDIERLQTVFSGVGAYRIFGVNLAYHGTPINGRGMFVSGSYFPVLGVKAAAGRLLGPADDRTIGGANVAVLTHAYWATHLGSDPGVVGQTILINGQPMTIIGVAPEGFEGTTLGAVVNVYIPISMRAVVNPLFSGFANRRQYWIYIFGRLKPGVTLERAQTAMNAFFHPIITDIEAPALTAVSPTTLADFKARKIVLTDGRRGQSTVREQRRAPMLLLFGITGVVLLIACANIANLLLARGANRASEMAVRLSLGATRGQLLVQLLTESLVLALVAGVVSLGVARGTLGLFMVMLPSVQAAALHFELNATALLFAAALVVGTGVLFGLFPALHATRPDLITTLRSGVGKHSGGRSAARFRSGLVTAQIALSMALLISAGLFVKSLRNLGRVNLGLDVNNVVAFQLSPSMNGYAPSRSRGVLLRVEQAVAAAPGVSSVGASLVPALSGENWDNSVSVQGFNKTLDTDDDAQFNELSPGYFHTMAIPILAGREFSDADVAGSTRVAIVNEAFAEKFHLGHDVIGKYMGQHRGDTLDVQIVGLVKNTMYSDVKNKVLPIYAIAYRQDTTIGSMTFYARTNGDPARLVRAIPGLVASIDPNLPVQSIRTMTQQVKDNIFIDRMVSTLSAAFAVLATLLAAVGLYGVLAYSVAQRTREIGVRMALGADGTRVRVMVLRQVAMMTLIGGAIGVGAAVMIGRYASALLFKLTGFDPVVIVLSVSALSAVALGAGYLPARKASRIDPTQALRYE
jgi:predicted permease